MILNSDSRKGKPNKNRYQDQVLCLLVNITLAKKDNLRNLNKK